VDRDLEPLGPCGGERLRHSTTLLDREQHALAGGPAGEDAVETAVRQEADEPGDGVEVE
jgi:hypothetical protein